MKIPHKNKCDLKEVINAVKRAEKNISKLYAVWTDYH